MRIIRAILICTAMLTSFLGSWRLYHRPGDLDAAVSLYGLALTALWLGTWENYSLAHKFKAWKAKLVPGIRAHRKEILACLVVFGLAVFMRVYLFGYFPPADGAAFEEVQTGGAAYGILNLHARPLEFPLTGYLPALAFYLWGESSFALRLPFLILGILTIAPFYLLLRQLFETEVALFGTLLLAVCRWHALGSRIADELFLPIFFEVSLLYFLVRGRKTGKVSHFFWLGILTGYTFYAYTAYRAIPFFVFLFFGGQFLWGFLTHCLSPKKGLGSYLRRTWAGSYRQALRLRSGQALVFLVAMLTVLGPLIVISARGNTLFVEAFLRHVFVRGDTALASLQLSLSDWPARIQRALLIFTHRGADDAALSLLGEPMLDPESGTLLAWGEPMLDPVSGVLLAWGVAYCLLTFYKPYRLFFLTWFFTILLVGAVFPLNFYVGRFSGLIPILFIVICFLIQALWEAWDRLFGWWGRRGFALCLIGLSGLALYFNYDTFFGKQVHNSRVRAAYEDGTLALCYYLASFPPDTYVYLWSETQAVDFLFVPNDYMWACKNLWGQPLSSLTEGLPVRIPSADVAYVVLNPLAKVEEISDLVQYFYPEASCRSVAGEQGLYTIVFCHVSRQVISQRQGLQGEYYQGSDFRGSPAVMQVDRVASLDWEREGPPLDVPFGVIWRGMFYMEQGGRYGLGSDTGDEVEIIVDSQCLFSTFEGEELARMAELAKGWHVLDIKLTKKVSGGRFNLYQFDEKGQKRWLTDGDLFALDPVRGLVRTRYFDGKAALRRIDPVVSFTYVPLLLDKESQRSGTGPRFTGEKWEGWLEVRDEGLYNVRLQSRGGAATLRIDGQETAGCVAAENYPCKASTDLFLTKGYHKLDINHSYLGGTWAGVRLTWALRGEAQGMLPIDCLLPYRVDVE
jgi:hypothetical protein